jgi:hypothetical protein
MSKSVKRVVFSILALALVVGTLTASALPRPQPCDVRPINCQH